MGQEDLKMAGGTQVMVPSNLSSALVLSSTRKSPTALRGSPVVEKERPAMVGGRLEEGHEKKGKMSSREEKMKEKRCTYYFMMKKIAKLLYLIRSKNCLELL